MLAPRVDADGNELGGVPVVLLDAPLGTYLGWNITDGGARPFHQGQICNYVGGMVPFARTARERQESGDPRLSLEERYGSHAGYVRAVRKAADSAMSQGFLLAADAERLIRAAEASRVLADPARQRVPGPCSAQQRNGGGNRGGNRGGAAQPGDAAGPCSCAWEAMRAGALEAP
jgi:Alpha/beta hydrolase domain